MIKNMAETSKGITKIVKKDRERFLKNLWLKVVAKYIKNVTAFQNYTKAP